MHALKRTLIILSFFLTGIIILLLYKLSVVTTEQNEKRLAEIRLNDSLRIDSTRFLSGKLLYAAHCNTCHNFYRTDHYFTGVVDRWSSKDTLKMFIRDPLRTAKIDRYSEKLIDDHDPIVMPSFPKLKDEELELMIYYMSIESHSKIIN